MIYGTTASTDEMTGGADRVQCCLATDDIERWSDVLV